MINQDDKNWEWRSPTISFEVVEFVCLRGMSVFETKRFDVVGGLGGRG